MRTRKTRDSLVNWGRYYAFIILLGLIAGLSGILSNVAANEIPLTWKPYLWLSWPLFILFMVIGIILTIWQSRHEDKAVQALSSIPSALAGDISYFVGRTQEEEEITRLLTDRGQYANKVAIICGLAGMGGIGKSALAIHLGHKLEHLFPDGILWANLRVEKPFDVTAKFARAYGRELGYDQNMASRVLALRSVLKDKKALMILDNVHSDDDVQSLLPTSSTMAAIITSREHLPSLLGAKVIDLDVLSDVEAKELLAQFVGLERVSIESKAADEICQLTGRLPLALAIAGELARRNHWKLKDLSNRLSDERQRLKVLDLKVLEDPKPEQNIRISFSLSYRRIKPSLRRFFRLLCLFPGSDFGIQSVAALNGIADEEAENSLGMLVNLALVQSGREKRYRLHDLMRLFASEKLEKSATSMINTAKTRYIHYYVDFATDMCKDFEMLELEHKNTLSALQYADEVGAEHCIALLTSYLSEFWDIRGYWGETENWMVRGLKICAYLGEEFTNHLATISHHLATIETYQGNYSKASGYLKDNLHAIEHSPDRSLVAESYRILGRITNEQGGYAEANQWLRKSEDIWLTIGDDQGLGRTYYQLGRVALVQEHLEIAHDFLQKSIDLAEKANDQLGLGRATNDLGMLETTLGNHHTARTLLERSLKCREALHDMLGTERTLHALGDLNRETENLEKAETCYSEALKIQQQVNDKRGAALCYRSMARLEKKRGNLAKALEWIRLAEELWMAMSLPESERTRREREKIEELISRKND